jgi:hypothetical protein
VPTTGTGAAGAVDLTPAIGAWRSACQPFVAGAGASAGIYEITSPSAELLDLKVKGADYTSTDCSDAGTITITLTYHLTVLGVKTIDSIQVFKAVEAGKPECVADLPEACAYALSSGNSKGLGGLGIDSAGLLRLAEPNGAVDGDGFPTQFVPLDPGMEKL